MGVSVIRVWISRYISVSPLDFELLAAAYTTTYSSDMGIQVAHTQNNDRGCE